MFGFSRNANFTNTFFVSCMVKMFCFFHCCVSVKSSGGLLPSGFDCRALGVSHVLLLPSAGASNRNEDVSAQAWRLNSQSNVFRNYRNCLLQTWSKPLLVLDLARWSPSTGCGGHAVRFLYPSSAGQGARSRFAGSMTCHINTQCRVMCGHG